MEDENYQFAIDIAEKKDEEHKVSNKLLPIQILFGKSSGSDRYIREVPKHLRDVNANAYEPQIIAIGPYHRNKPDLQGMEKQKRRCLKMVLQRTTEHDVERWRERLRQLKKKARACYVGTKRTRKRKDEFVEMMLLDACFIVELFRNYWQKAKHNEPLFDSRWMEQKLRRDLLLAENQIPFFVLDEFFKMTTTPDEEKQMDERNHFLTMIFSFFVSVLPNHCYEQDAKESFFNWVLPNQYFGQDAEVAGCPILPTTDSYPFLHSKRFQDSNAIKHLLSFVHDAWVHQMVRESPDSGTRNCNWNIFNIFNRRESPDCVRRYCNWKIFNIFNRRELPDGGTRYCNWKIFNIFNRRESPDGGTGYCNWQIFNIFNRRRRSTKISKIFNRRHCATKLREDGIKFREVESNSLLDIKFERGIVKIPRLIIDDGTECFFQNLIVYEQWYPEESNPVIDYINFMDSLINSEKDVELLCKHKIVDNCVGDDEVVAKMFNRLGDSVTFSSCDLYREIYEKMNHHCNSDWNKSMANLRHNYLNTPWALISSLAAVLLLLLTAGQTVFSVLAYFK